MATRLSSYRKVQPAAVGFRRERCHPVSLTRVSPRDPGEPPLAAGLRNLSTFGCRLDCEADLAAGTRLWLRLSGSAPIAATVIWSEEGVTACRFDEPIATRVVRSLTLPPQ